MTREEKQKAIDVLKISAPVMAVTPGEFEDYIQTLNKIMDWLEQEPCEDCISRKVVMEYIKNCTIDLGYENGTNIVLDAICNMPSIQPKPKTDVLDKIRAEIESNRNEWIKGEDAEWHTYDRCLLIIDKYKADGGVWGK